MIDEPNGSPSGIRSSPSSETASEVANRTGSMWFWQDGDVTPVRQPRGTGIALRDPLPWPEFARTARRAEEIAYTAVFLPEIAGRDAFAALAALAGETRELLLGTGVVPMTSREPLVMAMAAATVHE